MEAMKGHLRQRGKKSWELKFDAGRDPATGKRKIQYVSFRGTKREAQRRLATLIADSNRGAYVEPAKLAVSEHVAGRIDQWRASGAISPLTAARYRTLLRTTIEKHLGNVPLQRLRPADVER